MLETSARLLRLLSLLQARREWAGGELAERLEVDVRTARRDVDRLRRLGYPVHSVSGPAGGYRLGAGACRDAVRLRFDYLSHDGSESGRLVEPHRLVTLGPRWYLLAWDVDRAGWRTFRLDRISVRATGDRFTPRPLPGGDAAADVARGASAAGWRWRARVTVAAPAEWVVARINPAVGVVSPLGPSTCEPSTGAETLDELAVYLGLLGVGFTVTSPPELVAHLRDLAARYAAATPAP